MSRHLDREIGRLKRQVLALSAVVEDSVSRAVTAVQERDMDLAAAVVDDDTRIDQAEIEVEEECLKILALHQPVAHDLRFIIAVLKLNNDLERIGDLAANIAQQVPMLCERDSTPLPIDVLPIAREAQSMLSAVLDALVRTDAVAAREVLSADDRVDALHRGIYARVKAEVRRSPENAEVLIHLLSVSRYLERIADLATNIAEDILYLTDGEIVRHGHGGGN
jgi:phosphate transport system protein